jgi:hypothetical protein
MDLIQFLDQQQLLLVDVVEVDMVQVILEIVDLQEDLAAAEVLETLRMEEQALQEMLDLILQLKDMQEEMVQIRVVQEQILVVAAEEAVQEAQAEMETFHQTQVVLEELEHIQV